MTDIVTADIPYGSFIFAQEGTKWYILAVNTSEHVTPLWGVLYGKVVMVKHKDGRFTKVKLGAAKGKGRVRVGSCDVWGRLYKFQNVKETM